jgi:hypothetical protein
MQSQCTKYVEVGNKEKFSDKQFNDTIKNFFKSRWKKWSFIYNVLYEIRV